jgi:hypothetical protein
MSKKERNPRKKTLTNRSAVRKALKQACKDWGHTRKNIPSDALTQVEASVGRLIITIAAQGFKK